MKKFKIPLIFISLFSAAGILYYYFVFTTPGSRIAADQMISTYIDHEDLVYDGVEGNLGQGMTFENLEIQDIKGLPSGTVLKVEKIFLNLTAFSLDGVRVEIENARLKLPNSDPIVLSGTVEGMDLKLNIYSSGFTVTEILEYLPDFKKLTPVKGYAKTIDLYVEGNYSEPKLRGDFVIEKFIYKGFVLEEAPVRIDVQLKDVRRSLKIYGDIFFEKGRLQTQKVEVQLENGSLKFSGRWNEPEINFKGNARVEKTDISIGLNGTVKDPDLTLTSDPSYSREKLMVMLATGKTWKSIEDSIDQGQGLDSGALTRDFIDYFLFAGTASRFAQKFGITDFSVKFDDKSRGISAAKELTDNLQVEYGIEQLSTGSEAPEISQKVGGELKVTKELSVGVERETQKKQSLDLPEKQTEVNNDKVLIKFKKDF